MRGSPLLLLVLVAVGFALTAVPLTRLTGAEGAARAVAGEIPTAATPEAAGSVPTRVVIRFAHEPQSVTLTQAGAVVAAWAAPGADSGGQMEHSAALRLADDASVELLVEAQWPDGTPPTALGVELEPDGHETRRTTVWTDAAAVTELLTFSWK